MNSLAAALFTVLLVFAAACAYRGEPASDQHVAPLERTLVGQVLLPDGVGSRGVEVLVTVAANDGEPRVTWLLFDEQGRFTHTYQGSLTNLRVTAGVRGEVHRIYTEELSEVDRAGQVDVGVIDLRDRLIGHRMMLRVADGKPQGDVRVAMFYGTPPVGPYGEPVALGSRQFPPDAPAKIELDP